MKKHKAKLVARLRKIPHWVWFVGAVSVALMGATTSVVAVTTHAEVTITAQTSSVDVQQPLRLTLNQKLLQIDPSAVRLEPRVEGTWHIERSLLARDVLVFDHAQPLTTATIYTVSIDGARRVSGVRVALPKLQFTTEAAPGIAATSFGSAKVLAADAGFSVRLAPGKQELIDLTLTTKPKLALTKEVSGDTHTWKLAKGYLPQGKKLQITLRDSKANRELLKHTLPVAKAPQVATLVKATHFGKNDVATITFKEPMEQRQNAIRFKLDGEGEWRDSKTYAFTPSTVRPGTTYSYTLTKGMRTTAGGILTKAKTHHFSTPGRVAVVGMSPYGRELSAHRQVIRFSFNQPVDKASAEARLKLSRGKVQSKVWQGNTLVVTAVNFGAQQTVHAQVRAGVQPVFGLPSVQAYGLSFTTEIPSKKLGVPMSYQQHAQSCESASLRMALAYKGRHVARDMDILKKIGYDPRPLNKKKNVWDDPQQQFVGDVNGSQGGGTGWGVYAEPVAKAARSYGRGATTQYGVSTAFVANNIYKGNPVVLWGIWNETATQRSWKTPDGRKVSGPVPMHVRLVVGVKGKASNPVGFYIHDPITGPTYWTADYLLHNTRRAGAANQAVAVQ